MPPRERQHKQREHLLTMAQDMELRMGPRRAISAFDSEEARLAAWRERGTEIIERPMLSVPDARPWGWWRYESTAGERDWLEAEHPSYHERVVAEHDFTGDPNHAAMF